MLYEQRVEAYGDICMKFATLLVDDEMQIEQIVGSILMQEVPKSEKVELLYLQHLYARCRPTKGSWLFKQRKKNSKLDKQFMQKPPKSRNMNAWIMALKQLKVPERAALFGAYYLQLGDGALSELMQTPIETVRKLVKNGAAQLEKIVVGYGLHYINETNFQKYFDEDFGSTYNARRRLKQLQLVVETKKARPKRNRPIPKWIPIALAFVVLVSSLMIPFAFHQSKKLPFVDEELLEAAIIINSTGQPYYPTISDNYKTYLVYIVNVASMFQYIKEHDFDMSDYDQEIEDFKEHFISYLSESDDLEIQNNIFASFGVTAEQFYSQEGEISAMYTFMSEQMTAEQQMEMNEYYYQEFLEKYKTEIDTLYERFERKYDSTEKLKECTIKKVQLENPELDMDYIPEATQLCILPNGDVTYVYMDNFYNYFSETLGELEGELGIVFDPFNYHEYYYHLVEKERLSKKEEELMQLTQILAYAYEMTFPGWIEPVPVLKSEDLNFSN